MGYNHVLKAVKTNMGGVYFVYGHGGTGKTFLYRTIIAKLRSEKKIVLAVASSGNLYKKNTYNIIVPRLF
jgi:Cdc6-like AAA superfamily ATPase